MNVGKLYHVVYNTRTDIENNKLIALLSTLLSHLQQSVTQPSEATSKQFKASIQTFMEACEDCASNSFTVSEKNILEEISGSDYVGTGLYKQVELILNNNTVTPGEAIKELNDLSEKLNKFYNNSKSIDDAFAGLEVEYDYVDDNAYEIGYLIPRNIIDSTIKGLSNEFKCLDDFLLTVRELIGEGVESPQISKISNSNFQIFLKVGPAEILFIIATIERIVAIIKKIAEIRKIHYDMKEKKLPENMIKSMKEHIDKTISKEMDKTVNSLIKEYYKKDDSGRANELTTKLKRNLEYLADRIDKGAILEVKAGDIKEPDKETAENNELSEDYKKKIAEYEYLKSVAEKAENTAYLIESIKISGSNILLLDCTQGTD